MQSSAPRTLLVRGGDPRWNALFAAALPGLRVVAAPDDAESIDLFAGWNPEPGLFARLPRLQAVFALGAGVDAFLRRPDLPGSLPLVRLLDAGMAEQMIEYALLGVLAWQRHLLRYEALQQQHAWQPQAPRTRAGTRVAVLGLGEIGAQVARALSGLGYPVAGWSRTLRDVPGVRCSAGLPALGPLLEATDVLVNLLPSTADTRGLLDHARLAQLPSGALVVNAARGDQLDAEALLSLLDDGRLGGALLDVFASEPLPPEHPLWRHPQVRITPHVAAVTLPERAVEQIAANILRLQRGEAMHGIVDRARGY